MLEGGQSLLNRLNRKRWTWSVLWPKDDTVLVTGINRTDGSD